MPTGYDKTNHQKLYSYIIPETTTPRPFTVVVIRPTPEPVATPSPAQTQFYSVVATLPTSTSTIYPPGVLPDGKFHPFAKIVPGHKVRHVAGGVDAGPEAMADEIDELPPHAIDFKPDTREIEQANEPMQEIVVEEFKKPMEGVDATQIDLGQFSEPMKDMNAEKPEESVQDVYMEEFIEPVPEVNVEQDGNLMQQEEIQADHSDVDISQEIREIEEFNLPLSIHDLEFPSTRREEPSVSSPLYTVGFPLESRAVEYNLHSTEHEASIKEITKIKDNLDLDSSSELDAEDHAPILFIVRPGDIVPPTSTRRIPVTTSTTTITPRTTRCPTTSTRFSGVKRKFFFEGGTSPEDHNMAGNDVIANPSTIEPAGRVPCKTLKHRHSQQ
eukprot:Gregarina_sp_Poly_1__6565@NODE_351_length_9317_cov_65_080541_g294_i0_p3_GENE_NODE_351_length_9317_cov_65_080541_g294_i0NODE_351_length_9317_cov_65_080541_g294_i0_p3_ORF_typecomplete_len385_score53_24_NODE_351_length_9317_cov_65_080541_g294_i066287782